MNKKFVRNFDELKTVDGELCPTFVDAARKMGLMTNKRMAFDYGRRHSNRNAYQHPTFVCVNWCFALLLILNSYGIYTGKKCTTAEERQMSRKKHELYFIFVQFSVTTTAN
ncbi:hypothetical protein L596_016485 [Steinernema carpocapsae]|uniref:Uncharacterized protein n=1 Tax=Steinernema carpocapsae TaxID=34508 RepID=A0A4U5NI35_STECR|nr:hypothetical protein L596_016485 [Steinernema carpocapsae]